MKDGNEYGSIVALQPKDGNLVPELKRAVAELEAVRKRPCVCYVANLVRDVPETSIHAADHLPFSEMVGRIDSSAREVDVFLATPGGSAEQVNLFVEALRLIDQPESVPALQRAIRRLWALFYYTFDRAPVTKVLLSAGYTFIRSQANVVARHAR